MKTKTRTAFEAARDSLMKYCEAATDYSCEVNEDTYPIKIVFKSMAQRSLFDNNMDEDAADSGNLTIEVGLDTKVKSTLDFKMDSSLLKKFIKSAEKIAFLYYHAFREEAGDLTDNRELKERIEEAINKAE